MFPKIKNATNTNFFEQQQEKYSEAYFNKALALSCLNKNEGVS